MSELKVATDKALSEFTSWNVGGNAEYYVAPESVDELKEALLYSFEKNIPYTVLGGGTNVLVSDKGVKGLLIHTHRFVGVKILKQDKNLLMECLAGTPKSEALKVFMKLRLQPAVFLAGLPGDMAGGVVMNAGVGHKVAPREFHEIVHSIDVLELNDGVVVEKSFSKDEIGWQYRKSKNWQPGIISEVRVCWPNQPNENVLKEVREGNKRRKDTQPLNLPSCGSVFKNPDGDHAGRLIEASGLKGYSIGGAQVSEKHANFIVNQGSASANDIAELITHVQRTVEQKFGIRLTNEVVYLGDF